MYLLRIIMGLFSRFFDQTGERPQYYVKPATRRGLFRAMLKEKALYMIPLNFLYALFLIPTLAWGIYCFAGIERLIKDGVSLFSRDGLGWMNVTALGLVPCIIIASIGNTGIAKVMRNWARDEHAFIAGDFFASIKANRKEGLAIGAITSLIPLILYWYVGFTVSNADRAGSVIIPAVLSGLIVLVWLMAQGPMYAQAVTYRLKVPQIIKNGFIMCIAHFLTSLIIFIAELLPPAIFVLVMKLTTPELGILLMVVFYIIFGFSFDWLIKASYANRLCEEFINAKAGLPVRIGLREEE